mgnify:CR=1 FL=1
MKKETSNPGTGTVHKKSLKQQIYYYRSFYIMFIPVFIFAVVFHYLPMLGIRYSLFSYKGIKAPEFIGLANFERMFSMPGFWSAFGNTILLSVVKLLLNTFMAVLISILLNELRFMKFKKVTQTIVYLPHFMSWVVISYIVYAVLTPEKGYLNNIIVALGGTKIMWYQEPKYWPFILVLVNTWKMVGYNCILYYATICGIDHSLYEAAVMDGANRWHQITYITLPCLKSTIIILTLMNLGNIFRSDFGLFYQIPMNSGALLEVTNTIDTYVYRGLMQTNNIGMSSAAGVYQSIVGFVLVFTANMIVRKIDSDSSLF